MDQTPEIDWYTLHPWLISSIFFHCIDIIYIYINPGMSWLYIYIYIYIHIYICIQVCHDYIVIYIYIYLSILHYCRSLISYPINLTSPRRQPWSPGWSADSPHLADRQRRPLAQGAPPGAATAFLRSAWELMVGSKVGTSSKLTEKNGDFMVIFLGIENGDRNLKNGDLVMGPLW